MFDTPARLPGTEKTADIGVSVDGTWQRKGFTSILGLVADISLDSGKLLCVAILYFKNCEKAALDIMELLKVDPGYYMTKSCRSVNMRRKRLSIYRMSEP